MKLTLEGMKQMARVFIRFSPVLQSKYGLKFDKKVLTLRI